MASKRKGAPKVGKYTIHLGVDRVQQIERFRGKSKYQGKTISTIDEAVNLLVDRGLEYESLNA